MCGGPESRCVGRVYGADGAVHHTNPTHDLRSGLCTWGTLVRELLEIRPFKSKGKLSIYTPLRHVE